MVQEFLLLLRLRITAVRICKILRAFEAAVLEATFSSSAFAKCPCWALARFGLQGTCCITL